MGKNEKPGGLDLLGLYKESSVREKGKSVKLRKIIGRIIIGGIVVSGIGTIPFLLLETLKDLELSEQSIENWIGKLGMPLTYKTIQMIGIGSMAVSYTHLLHGKS